MDEEMLKKLEERLANGEISEDTYKKIKARYESEDKLKEEDLESEVDEDMDDIEGEVTDTGKRTKNVRLTGASKISGCDCEYFSSSGASKVEGNVKADEAKISGATKVEGDLIVKKLGSNGSIKVEGKTEADFLELSGASKFEGLVKADRIKSSGSTKFESSLTVNDIESSGAFKAEHNVKAESFKASGAFVIEATLEASEIMLRPGADCRIGNIKGGDVLVEIGGGGGFFSFVKKGSLKVGTIKGDDIYLEGTKADLVEGNSVRIGPGCKIDTVRGKDIKVHESASVKNREQL